jgi:hypothetical protein
MWAFDTRYQPFVVAIRANRQITGGPGSEINYEANYACKKHKEHPRDRIVHSSRFGIASDPNQESNLQS